MRLFGKKPEAQNSSSYEIFGGATIKRSNTGYEITWKGPHLMSLVVSSMPEIDSKVKTEQDGDILRVTSWQCKLRIVGRGDDAKAFISEP